MRYNCVLSKRVHRAVIFVITSIFGAMYFLSLSSCTMGHSLMSRGQATIITVDTTVISHDGYLKFEK